MIDYTPLFEILRHKKLYRWVDRLPSDIEKAFNHGDYPKWEKSINNLPNVIPSTIDFNKDEIVIGEKSDLTLEQNKQLVEILKSFIPWRKGPFDYFGNYIDTEWRSDWKWNRLKDHIKPLNDKYVLDVGCGNGYHCWRMMGQKPRCVVGVDPFLLSILQFAVTKKYCKNFPVYVLPIGIEHLPENLNIFNTVFSMGVLYHRKSPLEHLTDLKSTMREGGELILETIVIDGKLGDTLVPEGRYAQMRNVYFLPSILTLESWMKKCGYKNIRVIDITQTTIDEQHRTNWMEFTSLENGLTPANHNLTIEGYSAPIRAIFIAEK